MIINCECEDLSDAYPIKLRRKKMYKNGLKTKIVNKTRELKREINSKKQEIKTLLESEGNLWR